MTVEALALLGHAENMLLVGDGAAQLVITSPPFYDEKTEALLRLPRNRQTDLRRLEEKLLAYAASLEAAFNEIVRVLDRLGVVVLHTKDLRFGNALIPLSACHECLASQCGLRTQTKIFWLPSDRPKRSHRAFSGTPSVASFTAPELEQFIVMRHLGALGRRRGNLPGLANTFWLSDPIWTTPGKRTGLGTPKRARRRSCAGSFRCFPYPGTLYWIHFAEAEVFFRLRAIWAAMPSDSKPTEDAWS
jgi:hypothetical protein